MHVTISIGIIEDCLYVSHCSENSEFSHEETEPLEFFSMVGDGEYGK